MFSLFPITASFPMTPLTEVEGTHLVCLRRVNAMDTARVVLNLRPQDVNDYVSAGSPVKISWFANGESDGFVGYVHSFRPISDGYSQRTLVILVSAAYPMFTESGRVFYRCTIDNVAAEIADDYRFQIISDPHPLLREQILQGNDSDWAFLARLAEEWGYVLILDGVTLIFRRLDDLLNENYKTAQDERTQGEVFMGRPSSLISFEPSFSAAGRIPISLAEVEGVSPSVQGIMTLDPDVPTVIDGFREQTDRPVQSELERELVSFSYEMRKKFPFEAEATIQSPLGKKPMDAYRITHEGRAMTWTVLSIKHTVTGSNYIGEAVLGTDGRDRSNGVTANLLDVSEMLRRKQRFYRPSPVILDLRPFYFGTGGSVFVADQRWMADLLVVPIDDLEVAA